MPPKQNDDNSRVTVAILKSEMGHLRADVTRTFDQLVRRDEKRDSKQAAMAKELQEVQLTCALRAGSIEQIGKHDEAIGELKEDVAGLKAVSKKWGLAGIGTSITALATAAYAAFKSDVLGQ